MTLPEFALDYVSCYRYELQAFVTRRRLKVIGKSRSKKTYVETLTQADKEVKFRFLDLPAELRILVYRELLRFHDIKGPWRFPYYRFGCWPQILATCKEINHEADGIIQKINDFCVCLTRANVISAYATRVEALLGCNVLVPVQPGDLQHLAHINTPKQPINWNKNLRHLTHLELIVDLRPLPPHYLGITYNKCSVQECLYRLCSFLAPANKLERVDVQFHIPVPGYELECSLLFALAKLHIPDRLHIKGISEDLVDLLTSRAAADVTQEDYYARAYTAIDRLHALRRVVGLERAPLQVARGSGHAAHNHKYSTHGQSGKSGELQDRVPSVILDLARKLSRRLNMTQEYFDLTHDRELGRLVEELETRLDEELRCRLESAETKASSLKSELALVESTATTLKRAIEGNV